MTTDFVGDVGSALNRLMSAQDINQKILAEKTGHSRTYINKIIHGKANPSITVLLDVARVLGVSVSELTAGSEAKFGVGVSGYIGGIWSQIVNNTLVPPMFLTTSSGYIVDCNDQFLSLLKCTEREGRFINILNWLPTSDVPTHGSYRCNIVSSHGVVIGKWIDFTELNHKFLGKKESLVQGLVRE